MTTQTPPDPNPLLIFILGAPCSGKSTLSRALSTRYNLDHFSLGDELRSLISTSPTGAAASLKPLFTSNELATFEQNIRAGTLGPADLAPKYVLARIFPPKIEMRKIRLIIDGFPRKVERWSALKEGAKEVWEPDERTVVVILNIEMDVARKRFAGRGREGDEFERRFEEHEALIGGIVEEVKRDGVGVVEIDVREEITIDEIVSVVEGSEEWKRALGLEERKC